jgi:three-Cys-motif partner protein
MPEFHEQPFDEATELKLQLFRGYIREWLPVFLTRHRKRRQKYTQANIYDFFAGPGQDAEGNPGSPAIIVEELKRYCEERRSLKADNVDVCLVFNDDNQEHIRKLQSFIGEMSCPRDCCHIKYTSQPFQDALCDCLPDIQRRGSANLIIMDQFGVKEVTPKTLRQLADCSTTDILFFISSSFVRRFIEQPVIAKRFQLRLEDIKTVDYNDTHRLICTYYRTELRDKEYYLAPFSIKKGSNIYGVIFGSGHLLGLEKFLTVCWAQDKITGEANYNIDGDFSWSGKKSLFKEDNVIKKQDLFGQDLTSFIETQSPDNREIYQFCLIHGFLPRHAREILNPMQKDGVLSVLDLNSGKSARKGTFYLIRDNYKKSPKVRFTIRKK